MGYGLAIAPCVSCGRTFGFNPHLVPSIRVDGVKQPLCQGCLTGLNEVRKSLGLEPWKALPGAYDPVPEGEL